ncbi:MAG TPA: sugar ABC transporter substrate-binding protein [Geminicoccaceae bacterium]|nr:sugar ABC transporter substrate-binding protein [Geminicoccaceae bacterium]
MARLARRHLTGLLLAAALGAVPLHGALAQGGAPRIVVVTHGQAADPYWSVVKNGVDAAAKTQGANVEYRAPDTFDMVQMAQLVDAAVASRPDGLVVSIPDADALGPSVRRATEGGIPVIVIDSGGAKLTRELGGLLYLGQSEYEAGVAAGERVKALGVTKAACLNQEVGNVSLDDRCAGFAKGLGAEVPVVAGTIDPTEMKGRVAAYLRANPGVEFLLGCGVTASEPALDAVEELQLGGQVRIGTFDLSPGVLAAIDEGKMEFGIDAQQYLMGYMPIVMLDLLARYKLQPLADYPTGPGFVTKADAASVMSLSKQGIR